MSTVLKNLLSAVSEMFSLPKTTDIDLSQLNTEEVLDQLGSLDLISLVPSWNNILEQTLSAASRTG